MSSNNRRKAIFALILANTIWGAASPIFKLALQNIPPFTLAYIRFFGASLILFPFTYKNLSVDRKDWSKLILLSIMGITINISFFFWGLEKAPSINAPIIASSGPIFIYLFSIFILHEKAHPKILIGILLSLIGVLIFVGQPILNKGIDGSLVGNIFFVIAALGAVGHALISKKILTKYRSLTITFWSFIIGSITFLPFFVKEMVNLHPLLTLDYRGWVGITFGVLLSSALGYSLFEWGIEQIETQEVGIFTYIDPLVATLIALPLLGEAITPIFLIGSILIFAGIAIAEGRLHWHPLHKLT